MLTWVIAICLKLHRPQPLQALCSQTRRQVYCPQAAHLQLLLTCLAPVAYVVLHCPCLAAGYQLHSVVHGLVRLNQPLEHPASSPFAPIHRHVICRVQVVLNAAAAAVALAVAGTP